MAFELWLTFVAATVALLVLLTLSQGKRIAVAKAAVRRST